MNGHEVRVGIIGGSGVGQALANETTGDADGAGLTRHALDTPFGPPSDAIVETSWSGLPVFFLCRHGPGHLKNPSAIPYRANIFALKQLGVTHIIATGAVGSLRDEFKPRHLVIPDQVIDKTYTRPATFFDNAAVHVELAEPFCPILRGLLLEAAGMESEDRGSKIDDRLESASSEPRSSILDPRSSSPTTHARGCYVAMEGPGFSTRAESLMHRLWGGDLVGMTAMPEAKLAREAEMSYALVALVTDYDCWKARPTATDAVAPAALLEEIIGNLTAATANATALVRRTVALLAERKQSLSPSPAHDALRLAIWSDKSAIPVDEIDRLRVLWGRHFPPG
jgi:5'-methylthioadenosine phosphorylase